MEMTDFVLETPPLLARKLLGLPTSIELLNCLPPLYCLDLSLAAGIRVYMPYVAFGLIGVEWISCITLSLATYFKLGLILTTSLISDIGSKKWNPSMSLKKPSKTSIAILYGSGIGRFVGIV